MAENRCRALGMLVGRQGEVPADPHAYNHPAAAKLGCSHLTCSACGDRVQHFPGWAWSTEVEAELPQVLAADASSAVRDSAGAAAGGALVASDTGRLYRCRCAAHVEHQEAPIERFRETGSSGVGAIWQCAGHPARTVPATIDGVEVDPATANARAWVLAAIEGADASDEAQRTASQRLARLYFGLRGSAVESDVIMAIAALVNDSEPVRRELAVWFYALAPDTLGAERLGIWLAEKPELFASTPERYQFALITARRTVEAGRPYEPPVQELFRREALTAEHAPALYKFMAYHDRAWFIDHAHELPTTLHQAIRGLLPYTIARPQRTEIEARLDQVAASSA